MKKHKRMKKMLACIIASTMIYGLCACAGQSTGDTAAEAADYLTKEDITAAKKPHTPTLA